MSWQDTAMLALSVLLLVYLTVALLAPEKF